MTSRRIETPAQAIRRIDRELADVKAAALGRAVGGAGGPTVVYKTADESVVSSTTLQNDDHLLLAVGANESWLIHCYLVVDGSNIADFKMDITVPAGASGKYAIMNPNMNTAASYIPDPWVSLSTLKTSGLSGFGITPHVMDVYAFIEVGGTAGNVQLRWAQNNSDPTAVKVLKGSSLVAHQVA